MKISRKIDEHKNDQSYVDVLSYMTTCNGTSDRSTTGGSMVAGSIFMNLTRARRLHKTVATKMKYGVKHIDLRGAAMNDLR